MTDILCSEFPAHVYEEVKQESLSVDQLTHTWEYSKTCQHCRNIKLDTNKNLETLEVPIRW